MSNIFKKIEDIFLMHVKHGSIFSFIGGFIIASLSTEFLAYSYIDSLYPVAIGLIVASLGFINNDAHFDHKLIEQNKDVHTIRNILDRWWIILIAIIFPAGTWLLKLFNVILISSFYWVAFPLRLNHVRGLNIWYISTTRDYPILEKLFKENKFLVWGFKIALLIIFYIVYVNYYLIF